MHKQKQPFSREWISIPRFSFVKEKTNKLWKYAYQTVLVHCYFCSIT